MKRFAIFSTLILISCAGNQANRKNQGKADGKNPQGQMQNIGDSPKCTGMQGREELVDLNQDDRPDVRKIVAKVGDADVTICREADINFDGVVELVEVFNEKGEKKRDEVDLDYDHRIDVVSYYASGKVIKQELDTNSDGMADRVRYLENGVPTRLEGDTDQDGRIDYWEYYEDGQLMRVGMDTDGDGRADKWLRDDNAAANANDTDSDTADISEPAPDADADTSTEEPEKK